VIHQITLTSRTETGGRRTRLIVRHGVLPRRARSVPMHMVSAPLYMSDAFFSPSPWQASIKRGDMQHAGRTTNTFSKKYTARFTKSTYHVKCGPRKHLNFLCSGEPTAQAMTFPTPPPRSLNSSCRDASNHLSYAWFHRNFKTCISGYMSTILRFSRKRASFD
jgi:hypothetical protein